MIIGAVAQLARAPALQAGGQEFDSPQLHHANLRVSKRNKFFVSNLFEFRCEL